MIAVCCLEDTPARWVATHRLHHHRADDRADPHSPLVNLFLSYIGWLFVENTDLGLGAAYDRYARDIIRDKFYRWIERTVVWITLAQSLVYFAAGFLIELSLGGSIGVAAKFGASVWLWGVVVRTILVWHVTWCGNSFPCSVTATTRPTTTAATTRWWPSSPAAKAGITITTPNPTPPPISGAGGRSI
jgi:stearoyl-CoA desaturase (delta-9 desaturase)